MLFLIIVVTLQCFVKVSLKTWAKVNLISFVMGLSLFLGTYFWGKLPHQFVLASLVACRPLIFMNVGLLFHASHSNYDFIDSLYQTFEVGKERTHALTYPVRFRDYSLLGMSILLSIGMIFK